MTVFWINPGANGRLAIVPRPRSAEWLANDLSALRRDGIDILVSLLTKAEAAETGSGSRTSRSLMCRYRDCRIGGGMEFRWRFRHCIRPPPACPRSRRLRERAFADQDRAVRHEQADGWRVRSAAMLRSAIRNIVSFSVELLMPNRPIGRRLALFRHPRSGWPTSAFWGGASSAHKFGHWPGAWHGDLCSRPSFVSRRQDRV